MTPVMPRECRYIFTQDHTAGIEAAVATVRKIVELLTVCTV